MDTRARAQQRSLGPRPTHKSASRWGQGALCRESANLPGKKLHQPVPHGPSSGHRPLKEVRSLQGPQPRTLPHPGGRSQAVPLGGSSSAGTKGGGRKQEETPSSCTQDQISTIQGSPENTHRCRPKRFITGTGSGSYRSEVPQSAVCTQGPQESGRCGVKA